MLHSALQCKKKNESGMVKAHFITMIRGFTCCSVLLGLRVSNGLNGYECKYSLVGQGVVGASLKGQTALAEYMTAMTDCGG